MSEPHSITATSDSPLLDRRLAYGVLRLTMGIDILIHGVGRLFWIGVGAFAAKTSALFVGSPLPHTLVYDFLVCVPFAEATLGALTLLGLFTRWALTLGGLLIAALVFGTGMRSDWITVGTQLIYAIIYYFLLRNRDDNYFSVDTLLAKKP